MRFHSPRHGPGILAAVLLAGAAGCSGGGTSGLPPGTTIPLTMKSPSSGATAEPTTKAEAKEPEKQEGDFEPVTRAGLSDAIAANKGKVVVVNFWAEFCPPCRAEMPQFVQMHNKYAADGLVFLLVNIDDPRDRIARSRAIEFVSGLKVPFAKLAPVDRLSLENMVKHWKFSVIPQSFVYDREGKLAKHIEGADVEELESAVQRLLKK
jgi:thiol-disulfide isomerase/thioredoxin